MAKGIIIIDEGRCKGCGLCVEFCPPKILQMAEDRFNVLGYPPAEVTDMESCTGCQICALMCPDVCFTVYRQRKAKKVA